MPDLGKYKALVWAALAALALALLWATAKAVVPFVVGLIAGAAAGYFFKKGG